jgi:4-amino-4-deoxy-L-arabinose transferase-like glycosyltransferase
VAADSPLTSVSAPRASARAARRDPAARPPDGALVAAMAALAVAVRLAWVLAVPTHPVGDFAMYWESAAYLVAHGALDPHFIYMPGYVAALAAVQALGGGVFAAKLVGVASGGLAAAAATGLASRLFDDSSAALARGAAIAAGLLAALWPAGVAASSVLGTDMPTAALLVAAAWLLVRDADLHPWRAAVLFGLVMGLAAWVRAVALPLAVLAAPLWWALRARPLAVLKRTALSCAVAFLVLLPWGLRNFARYHELFLTDSHGGHTALVGANPDTEGVYSRSLNLMFTKATGYALGEPPHREADRAAYALARQWTALEPSYALGLLGAKADRLLTRERPLLYWPLYRQGVLAPDPGSWLARHRTGLERLVDIYWDLLVAAALVGLVVAASRRIWPAVALALFPAALAAIYVAFFSEVRYHLAIAVFLFPSAGYAWRWLVAGARDGLAGRLNERGRRRLAREAALGAAVVTALYAGWPRVVAAGAQLRDTHRWAVAVCAVDTRDTLCAWRPTIPAPGEGASGVRGVWNGFGLKVSTALAAAATDIDLPPGRYRVSVAVDTATPASTPEVRLSLKVSGSTIATADLPLPAGAPPARLSGAVEHQGGNLRVEAYGQRLWSVPTLTDVPTVWISDLKIEAEVH